MGDVDHVFALMHLLGFRFAPRIRDLADTKLYIPKKDVSYDALKPMIGAPLVIKHIRTHWDDILRLSTSIKQGTVTASLMLRKLGSYPRQNGLCETRYRSFEQQRYRASGLNLLKGAIVLWNTVYLIWPEEISSASISETPL
jgi:TnpA family transposase